MCLIWKDVVGYEGHYQVSNIGEIRSVKNRIPHKMSTFLNGKGYPRITLTKGGRTKQVFVHRLVAEAFIGNIPRGMTVNHIDGNKTNNKIENLEIVTNQENVLHSCYVLGGLIKPVYMLDPNKFEVIQEFEAITIASKTMNIDLGAICKVCSMERNFAGGYSWIFKEDYNKENIEKKKNRLRRGNGRKPVCQINPLTNEIINIFDGIGVAEKALGISTIRHCVTGRAKRAGGYKWEYLKEVDTNENKIISTF